MKHSVYLVPLDVHEDRPPFWRCRACGREFGFYDDADDSECPAPELFPTEDPS